MAKYHKHPAVEFVRSSLHDDGPYEMKFPLKHLGSALTCLTEEFGSPEEDFGMWTGGSIKRWKWDGFIVHQYEEEFAYIEVATAEERRQSFQDPDHELYRIRLQFARDQAQARVEYLRQTIDE